MLRLSRIKYANISSFSTTGVHLTHASQLLSAENMSVRHQKRTPAAAAAENKART